MRLLPLVLAALFLPSAALAQSSSSHGSPGSSGSARTQGAPPGTLRSGPGMTNPSGPDASSGALDDTLERGIAPGSSGAGMQQEAQVPRQCGRLLDNPRCPPEPAPRGPAPQPYGPADSPVKGGPPFDTGPTGLPLDLPREDR